MIASATSSTPCIRRTSARAATRRSVAPTPIAPASNRRCLRSPPVVAAAASAAGDAAPSTTGPTSSPFASASVHRKVGDASSEPQASSFPPLSVEAVDACLDEVRPYLIADGGDVEVVSASGSKVELRLRGACSSCASSDATMRMGLERAIRARFGSGVEVAQVSDGGGADGGGGAGAGGGPARATLEAVDGHLNTLRSAVAGLGGRVRVAELVPIGGEGGASGGQRATVYYRGPRSIGNGIRAAILERFAGDVVEVDMVDFPEGHPEA